MFRALALCESQLFDAANAELWRALGVERDSGLISNPRTLEPFALGYLRNSQWKEAFALYRIITLTGQRDFEWISRKLAWRIEYEAQFRKNYGNADHGTRIRQYFREKLRVGIDDVQSSKSVVGYVGMATYCHQLSLENADDNLLIYEKVFEGIDRDKVEREAILFETIPSQKLHAPAYYGFQEVGPFISLYSEYVAGTEISEDRWGKLEADLMYKYWAVQPSPELASNGKIVKQFVLDVIANYKKQGDPGEIGKHLKYATYEETTRRIDSQLTAIYTKIQRTPLFVFHRDFHRGNVLLENGASPKVFDWEQWSLEPIGVGWLPFARFGEIQKIDIRRIRASRPVPDETTEDDLLLMASIWGFFNGAQRGDAVIASAWLEQIARCC